jgi:hypothetical protein
MDRDPEAAPDPFAPDGPFSPSPAPVPEPSSPHSDSAQRAAGRRSNSAGVLVLLLACAALLHDTLGGARHLTQLDALLQFEPWIQAAPEGFRPGNPLLLDQSLIVHPWHHFAREELLQGRLPLWNPYNYGGQPVHAAYTAAFLWPLHWLYLLSGSFAAYAWIALLKLTLAGAGMLFWLRRQRLSSGAATLGGLTYALCGFNIAWLGHPHTNVSALVPWALLCIDAVAARPRVERAVPVALVAGLMLVGGHIQTATHAALVLAAYALFRTVAVAPGAARLGLGGWTVLAIGGAGGVSLAAPALWPFAEYLGHSQAATLFEAEEATSPLALRDAAPLLLAPGIHGDPRHGNYRGPLGDNLNYNELIGPYVGAVALTLAAVGLWTRRRQPLVLFLGGLALCSLALAWQLPPLWDWLREVPRLRSTKLMRFGLFAALALAALAAIGVERWLGSIENRRRRAAAAAAILGLVALELLGFARGYNPATPPEHIVPPTPTVEFLGPAEAAAAALEGPGRVLGLAGTTLFPNANLFHRLALLGGYDSIEDRRWVELMGCLTTDPRAALFVKEIGYFDRAVPLVSLLGVRWVLAAGELPPPLELQHRSPTGLGLWRNPQALPRAFLAQSLRVEPDPAAALARLAAEDFDPTEALVESAPPGGPRAGPLAGGSARLASHAPGRATVEVQTAGPGLLVFTEAFDPGWRASVDGRPVPVARVDHALCGVWLESGDRRVEMRYTPRSFWRGLWCAAAGSLALLCCHFGPRLRRRRSP